MNIDWSKAPDWAVAHGLHETGFGIKEFWLGETQHQNLEHAKSFPYGGGDPSCGSFHNSRRASFSYVTPRPAPWTGEGLPPVGTVCEYQTWVNREWKKTKVLAHHLGFAVHSWSVDGDDMEVDSAPAQDFRPLSTPEQIAAEEREAALKEMIALVGGSSRRSAEALYDAGYRKQPAP